MNNPFTRQMVKVQKPEGMGEQFSIGGFLLEFDDKGQVELPRDLLEEAKAHGLTEAPAEEAPAPKKRGG